MPTLRTRRDLSFLLERQMTAAATRYGVAPDDEVEGRAALKTYLLETFGRMREEPNAVLGEVAAAAGLMVQPTEDPELMTLTQGDLTFHLETSDKRFLLLYTAVSARDADRVHDALVYATPWLAPVWILPEHLEAIPRSVDGRMVLFSLRHDRRTLQREQDDDPTRVDFVTLRFWAPSAEKTLSRLRDSVVLPNATSVYSVRVRVGKDDAYAVAEAFHTGKLTSVGTSFEQHKRIVRAALEQYTELAQRIETTVAGTRRIHVPVHWPVADLAYTVGRMFTGAEPFRLWGLPVQTDEQSFRVRAVDLDTGQIATFHFQRDGVTFELGTGAAASLATRFVANLQYHVSSEIRVPAFAPEPLVARSDQPARSSPSLPFEETSAIEDVARAVASDACALRVQGTQSLSAQKILAHATQSHVSTPALLDLVRRVMTELAAHEWHPLMRPVLVADGSTQWRFHDPLPVDSTARTRDLVRMNRMAEHAVARLSGRAIAPWLQLSLFAPDVLVPAVPEPNEE